MEENKKVIKSLSTVLNDGTLSEGIPFGAKAENVELASGTKLQDVFEVKTVNAYDGPFTLDRDHGTDPDSWMGFFTSFEIEEGKTYDVILGDRTYTGLVSKIFSEEDGMKAVGISSTGEPVTYGTVGEWQLVSMYQNGTFLTTMFDTYDAVDKYQNGSYLKISYTDEEIKEMFLPEDYTDITIQDLDELTITLITERTGLSLDSFMMALMGMNVSILNKVRVCLMEETPMGGLQFKYFKFYLGDWDIASDSPVICLMSDPYVKANGKVYIDTFKGYITNDQNMSIQGELITKCINNAQPDWEIPGETSEASIKNKPFYEEKLLFEEHISFETAETVEHEFLKWEKEGDFEFTDSAYLEFTPYGITDGTVYTFQPNDTGEEYIQFRDIPVDGIDTTKVFHVSFHKYNPGTSDFRTPNTIEVEFTVDDPTVVPTISWEKLALYSGVIKKLDSKFLPEGYGASDWDQSDKTAADYIKNRPFYEVVIAEGEETIISPESEKTFTLEWEDLGLSFYYFTEEEKAEWATALANSPTGTVKGTFDGEPFVISAPYYVPVMGEGIFSEDGRFGVAQEFFILARQDGPGTHTLEVIFQGAPQTQVVKKLDKKFLPDEVILQDELVQSDWNQSDETAIDYVKNRTHYATTEEQLYLFAPEQNLEIYNENGTMKTSYYLSTSGGNFSESAYYNEHIEQVIEESGSRKYVPMLFKITIDDNVAYYEGTADYKYGGGWIGWYYDHTMGDWVGGEDLLSYYPYIKSFGKGGYVYFNSTEETDEPYTIPTIKMEVIGQTVVYKTLDREFMPYYQGSNYAEAFNSPYNTALGANSHVEGGDAGDADICFYLSDCGYLNEAGESQYLFEVGKTTFVLPIEKGINYTNRGDCIRPCVSNSAWYPSDFEEKLMITDVTIHTSWEEKEYSLITLSREITEKDLEDINNGYSGRALIWTTSYVEEDAIAAHIEGVGAKALKFNEQSYFRGAHAEGIGTVALKEGQHVQGRYNILNEGYGTDYAHIVGNGSRTNRSNAHTLDWNGNAWYSGKVTAGADPVNAMDLVTKQYLDEHLSDITIENASSTVAGVLKVRLDETTNTLYMTNDGSDA